MGVGQQGELSILETSVALTGLTLPVRIGFAVGSAEAVEVLYTRNGARRRAVGRPAQPSPSLKTAARTARRR